MKNFLLKQIVKKQTKNLPPAEQEKIIKLVSENPELFQKIGAEIQEEMKAGKDQQQATMAVLFKYQSELQKIANQ